MRSACCWASSLAAASEPRDSAALRARNSWSSWASRAEKSWTTLLRWSSEERVSDTLGSLFTVFTNFAQQLIELFNYCDGFIHASKQIVHETLLELLAFGVFPIVLRFEPTQGKLFADGRESALAAG